MPLLHAVDPRLVHMIASMHIRKAVSVSTSDLHDDNVASSPKLSRRTLIAGSTAAAGLAATGISLASAQESTPAAADATPATETSLPAVPPEIDEYANDWPLAQGDLSATRVAIGGTIDSTNVATLGVAWEYYLDASSIFGAITSNPIVQGDTVYLVDNAGNVHAINRETGELRWRKDFNVPTGGPNGLAIGYGILTSVLGDTAEVVALDPATGDEIWRFQIANHGALGITMAPFIYNGWVIVSSEPGGNTKGVYEGGANGVVYALDITTGETIWSWDTVEDDLWGNFRVNSGGGLWYPPSVDEEGNLYMGIGNAGPFPGTAEFPNASSRPGKNNYANNLVKLDPNAGAVVWSANVKPRDLFDLDNQQTPVLATVQIGGVEVEVVFTTGKHGYVAAYHRDSGQEFWRRSVGYHQNDGLLEVPEGETIEVFPGVGGGVESPIAFKDGILYVAAWNYPTTYSTSTSVIDAANGYGSSTTNLVALDAATGDIIWDNFLDYGICGSGLVISNDVILTGVLDGRALAFSIDDGSLLWESQTGAGINAPGAVAGDTFFVPAGSAISGNAYTPDPAPGYYPALIAYRLGATGTPTFGETTTQDTSDIDGQIVRAIDLAFEPNAFTIAAGTDVEITLVNDGVLQHDFVIETEGIDSDLINGGERVTFTVNLPAGTYQFICSVEGHAEAGMVGTLTVA